MKRLSKELSKGWQLRSCLVFSIAFSVLPIISFVFERNDFNVGQRIQLNLCTTTTLVKFVSDELPFPCDAELNPELYAPSEDRDCSWFDAPVGINKAPSS